MDTVLIRIQVDEPFDPIKLRLARQTILDYCYAEGMDEEIQWSMASMADELACNILEHGRATWIQLELVRSPEGISLVVRDNGVAFDPTMPPALDPDAERGLGLQMVHSMAPTLTYRRGSNLNETCALALSGKAA